MTFRVFTGLAFVIQLLLGNVCFLGTSYAAGPIDDAAGAFLSQEVPMSLNVVACDWIQTEDGWAPTPDSPCASGQCIQKDPPEPRCIVGAVAPLAAASMPPPLFAVPFPAWTDTVVVPLTTESPPLLATIDSIVMRM